MNGMYVMCVVGVVLVACMGMGMLQIHVAYADTHGWELIYERATSPSDQHIALNNASGVPYTIYNLAWGIAPRIDDTCGVGECNRVLGYFGTSEIMLHNGTTYAIHQVSGGYDAGHLVALYLRCPLHSDVRIEDSGSVGVVVWCGATTLNAFMLQNYPELSDHTHCESSKFANALWSLCGRPDGETNRTYVYDAHDYIDMDGMHGLDLWFDCDDPTLTNLGVHAEGVEDMAGYNTIEMTKRYGGNYLVELRLDAANVDDMVRVVVSGNTTEGNTCRLDHTHTYPELHTITLTRDLDAGIVQPKFADSRSNYHMIRSYPVANSSEYWEGYNFIDVGRFMQDGRSPAGTTGEWGGYRVGFQGLMVGSIDILSYNTAPLVGQTHEGYMFELERGAWLRQTIECGAARVHAVHIGIDDGERTGYDYWINWGYNDKVHIRQDGHGMTTFTLDHMKGVPPSNTVDMNLPDNTASVTIHVDYEVVSTERLENIQYMQYYRHPTELLVLSCTMG